MIMTTKFVNKIETSREKRNIVNEKCVFEKGVFALKQIFNMKKVTMTNKT